MSEFPINDVIFNRSADFVARDAVVEFEKWLTATKQLPGAMPPETIEINNLIISPSTSHVLVIGSENNYIIQTIATSPMHNGAIVYLSSASAGYPIVLRSGGNISTTNDIPLSVDIWVSLQRIGDLWVHIKTAAGGDNLLLEAHKTDALAHKPLFDNVIEIIDDLSPRVSSVESIAASNTTSISNLQAEATAKWVILNNTENAINNLTPRVAAVESIAATNAAAIAGHETRIVGLEAGGGGMDLSPVVTRLDEIDAQLVEIENNVTANTENITSIDNDITMALSIINGEVSLEDQFPTPGPDGTVLTSLGGVAVWAETGDSVPFGTTFNLTTDIGSLQAAIDTLPKTIFGNVFIAVNPGTYNGTIEITGFEGSGFLQILGAGTIGSTHNIYKLYVHRQTLRTVEIIGFNSTATSGNCFACEVCPNEILVSACSATSGSSATSLHRGLYVERCGLLRASDCVFSNKATGVYVTRSGTASLETTTGTANSTNCGISTGSFVHVDNTTQYGLLGTNLWGRSGGIFVFSSGDIIGTRVWTSAEYTPVQHATTIATHGIPNLNIGEARAEVWLKCAVANNGYSVGDIVRDFIMLNQTINANYFSVGSSLLVDDTTIRIQTSTTLHIANKTTAAAVGVVMSNWRYVFKIWH